MKWRVFAWKLNMVERGQGGERGRDQRARAYRRTQVERKLSKVDQVRVRRESLLAGSKKRSGGRVFYLYGQGQADRVWKAGRYRARPYRHVFCKISR